VPGQLIERDKFLIEF